MAEEGTKVKEEIKEPDKVATPEPSHLDKLEKSILSTEKKEEKKEPEKKLEDEEEVVDFDWDKAMEKHPNLAKLGVKDVADVFSRYEGGLEDFQKNAAIVKELKKLGYETSNEREELFKKLATKEDVAPPSKPETEKTSRDLRVEKLAQLVPQQVRDSETGEARATTEEEKVAEQKRLESFAESVSPGDLPDRVDHVDMENLNLQDDLSWLLFKLQPLLKKHDDLLSDDIRKQILDHSKQFPQTYAEIVLNAKKNGKNHYEAVYHHFITTTKQEQIDAEKKKNWETEHKADEEKRMAAQAEAAGKPGGPEKAKTFSDMSLVEKEKHIESQK